MTECGKCGGVESIVYEGILLTNEVDYEGIFTNEAILTYFLYESSREGKRSGFGDSKAPCPSRLGMSNSDRTLETVMTPTNC